jgi:hypothetical protein
MSSQITTNQTPFPAFVSFVEDNLGFGGILSTQKNGREQRVATNQW